MYHSYFGLDEQAFSIAVNPRYLYMSAQHREALAHLLYGVNSGGFVMLSGEVGTGKTTIIRCLLEQLPQNAELAIVMNPSASARDLLCSICDEFSVSYPPEEQSLKVLTDALTEFLVRNHRAGKKSIVLIDEAQLLQVATLEQVRLLTNLETNTQKLLQIILVGQPELNELLAKPDLRQLSQRITARYHLRPLSEQETGAYIKHRLTVAGMPAGRQPFPPRIINKIHLISRGIPRLINILCDRMLLGAYSREVNEIDAQIFRQAVLEVLGNAPEEAFLRRQKTLYAVAGAVAIVVVASIIWLLSGSLGQRNSAEPATNTVVAGAIKREASSAAQSVVQAAQSSAAPEPAPLWQRNQERALEQLLLALGIEYDKSLHPCRAVAEQGLKCQLESAQTWEEFLAFDRPAVLSLVTPAKHSAYLTLIGIRGDEAWVRIDGRSERMPLAELGRLWNGEFTFVWQRPQGYKEALGLGSRGAVVTWVAEQFAQLDGQDEPLTDDVYNQSLQQRVKIFQRQYGLEDDGFVGLQTLLKLNAITGADTSLAQLEPLLVSADNE